MKLKKTKNTSWFDKNGLYRKSKWRMYCRHNQCLKYIIMHWEGQGGHMAYTNSGDGIDVRNQCYVCKKHQKEYHDGSSKIK